MTGQTTEMLREVRRMFPKILVMMFLLVLPQLSVAALPEVSISEDEFKALDTFEGVRLGKADKVFAAKEYRQAAAEYDAFILEFPKSPAIAYAVFRKARCVQLDNKRFDAIKAYNEVLDYFPNQINYAAAALYFIGECNFENGDVKEAMKAWAELAGDKDYKVHYLAAGAINRLADNLYDQGKTAEAMDYYRQVVVDFRRANKDNAWYALNKFLTFYIRTSPSEAKLKELYEKAETFEWDPNQQSDDNYWGRLREYIRNNGNFADVERDKKSAYFRYWADAMQGKRIEDDDFQIEAAGFRLNSDGDVAKWKGALDQQFTSRQKDGEFGRIVKWISAFRSQKDKVQEYYAKLDFAKMTPAEIQWLMRVMFDEVQDVELAKTVFSKIPLDKLNDGDRYNLERYLWNKGPEFVERVCAVFEDKENGKLELLRYFHWARNYPKGIPLADEVAGMPRFSKDAYWMKAEMLQWQNKFQEAIAVYQSADNPPHNMWRIADCYLSLGKRDQGIGQFQEIENFFADQAPEAAWRTALVWRDSKEEKMYVSALRGIMKKYPKSGQSSAAHQELERLGYKIGGGTDAE